MPGTSATNTAWTACTKIVEAATKSCAIPPPSPPPLAPNWDALANSFASLSAAFAWGSLFLAIVAIIAGIGWAKYVAGQAENEARTEAAKCAKAYIEKWLIDEAPGLVRNHVELLRSTTITKPSDDDTAADRMGEGAG